MADLTITPSGVLPGAGAFTGQGVAGENLTRGQSGYRKKADGRIYKALASSAASPFEQQTCVGIIAQDVAAGQPGQFYRGGQIAIGANVTAGVVSMVSSANAGGVAPAADNVATNYTTVLAVGISG